MDKKGKHHLIRFWKNKKPASSSGPSTSRSSLPIPVVNVSSNPMPPNTAGTSQGRDSMISGATTADQKGQTATPDIGAAITTVTAPAPGTDANYPRVSRTENWLGRATLFLKVTKDVADATEILAPLKAACGATITLLEAVQVRGNL
jgi:hypothetical protein